MTMNTLNALIDASIRGTLLGITASFWVFGLVAIWKWFFRIMKRLVQWLFPNLFKKRSEKEEQ